MAINALVNLAQINSQLGKYEEAISFYTRGLEKAEMTNNKYAIERNLSGLADVYQAKGEAKLSILNGKKALRLAEEMNLGERVYNTKLILARAYHLAGDDTRAYTLFNEYTHVKDSLSHFKHSTELEKLKSAYSDTLLRKENYILAQNNALLLQQDEIQILELNRRRILNFGLGGVLVLIGVFLGVSIGQNKKIKQTNLFLRESQFLKAKAERQKDRLIKLLMHDLKAPLSLIRGSLFLLGMEEDVEDERGSLIHDSQQACENILQMSLQAGQLSADKMPALLGRSLATESVTPAKILAQIHSEFSPLAKNFEVNLELPEIQDETEVVNNPLIIRHILGNLVHNALKFSKKKTQVLIAYQNKVDQFIFNVIDNGPGIPPEVQPHIFELEENGRVDHKPHGLALSHKLATSLGATISFHTKQGEGTVFQLALPKKQYNDI